MSGGREPGGGRPWTGAVPGLLVAAFVGYCVVPMSLFAQQVWYDCGVVLGIVVGFVALRVRRPAHPRGWRLVLFGFAGWAIGDLIWHLESMVYPGHFPAPSDAVYLTSYLVMGLGLLAIVRARGRGGDRAALLDAAIVTTGVAILVTVFLIAPLAGDTTLSLPAKLTSIAYPAGDIFLLACLMRMLTSPGAKNVSYFLLASALVVTTGADAVWAVLLAVSGDASSEPRWLNAGWLAAYLLAAAAVSVRSMKAVAEPVPVQDFVPFSNRRLVAMIVGLLLPAAALFADGLDDSINWIVISAGSAVMSVLLLARFVDLLSIVQRQAVQLGALARTDELTGAPNRRTWDHELSRACRVADQQGSQLCVAVIDLDHFKLFNDAHGHPAGDRLLRDAVLAWTDALPPAALLARYGGEEFGVLLPGHGPIAASAVLTGLQARTPARQTFSAGIATWSTSDDASSLLAKADRALYEAKRTGRNKVVVASTPTFAGATGAGLPTPRSSPAARP